MTSSWFAVRNAPLRGLASAVERDVLDFVERRFGRRAHRLTDLTPWLLEREKMQEGAAREIRAYVKDSAVIRDILVGSPAAELATCLLGQPAELHGVVRFRTVMRDYDFTRSRAHQDAALWPDERRGQLNMWLALCEVDTDLAPLELLEDDDGRLLPHRENEYGQLELADAERFEGRYVPAPLTFGELLVFEATTIHRSSPNRTDGIRWSIDFRFVSAGHPAFRSELTRENAA
ncbi:MAG: phytanoyl-CoA dioxygenase family protein [Alphaproteobacteria bacterium]